MSNTVQSPVTVDSDSPYTARPSHVSEEWKLTAVPTVDGPTTAPVATVLRAFVNLPTLVKGQSSTTEHADAPDYRDGYGGTYAVGE